MSNTRICNIKRKYMKLYLVLVHLESSLVLYAIACPYVKRIPY